MDATVPRHTNPAAPPVERTLLHRILVSAMYGGLGERPGGRCVLDGRVAPLVVAYAGTFLWTQGLIGLCRDADGYQSAYLTMAGVDTLRTWDLELLTGDGAP